MAAYETAAQFLRSHGFAFGVEDDDPLDLLRLIAEIDRQNCIRPSRHLLGVAVGDVFAPRTVPLAQQRSIERRLAWLPPR